MDRINERIYYLLTLSRKDLMKEFSIGWTVFLVYLVPNTVLLFMGRTHPYNLIVWLIAAIVFTGFVFVFDRFRLDVWRPTEEASEEVGDGYAEEVPNYTDTITPSHQELMVESTEEDIEMFTFKDLVSETFKKKDAAAMTSLIMSQNELMLKEVLG